MKSPIFGVDLDKKPISNVILHCLGLELNSINSSLVRKIGFFEGKLRKCFKISFMDPSLFTIFSENEPLIIVKTSIFS